MSDSYTPFPRCPLCGEWFGVKEVEEYVADALAWRPFLEWFAARPKVRPQPHPGDRT